MHVVGSQLQLVVGHGEVGGHGADAVVDVHHGQARARFEVARVVARGEGVVEYRHRVVCVNVRGQDIVYVGMAR